MKLREVNAVKNENGTEYKRRTTATSLAVTFKNNKIKLQLT
jgi:hypothetical protein